MAEAIPVCKLSEVRSDEPVSVHLDGFPPLAVYQADKKYYVTDNSCTHGLALLTDGFQDGVIIECPLHGGSFNIQTGEPLSFPCVVPLRTYPVEVRDGWITIFKEG